MIVSTHAFFDPTSGELDCCGPENLCPPGRDKIALPEGFADSSHSWSVEDRAFVFDEAKATATALTLLRAERAALLTASDFTQLPDSPITEAKREEWATYRQNLRDLPETADPLDFDWPLPPS